MHQIPFVNLSAIWIKILNCSFKYMHRLQNDGHFTRPWCIKDTSYQYDNTSLMGWGGMTLQLALSPFTKLYYFKHICHSARFICIVMGCIHRDWILDWKTGNARHLIKCSGMMRHPQVVKSGMENVPFEEMFRVENGPNIEMVTNSAIVEHRHQFMAVGTTVFQGLSTRSCVGS